jgi:hypothetical protein
MKSYCPTMKSMHRDYSPYHESAVFEYDFVASHLGPFF